MVGNEKSNVKDCHSNMYDDITDRRLFNEKACDFIFGI